MSLKRHRSSVSSTSSLSSNESDWRIQKTERLGPGRYNLQKSWESTQLTHIKGNTLRAKSERTIYFEAYAKMFAKIPAPNKYPNAL